MKNLVIIEGRLTREPEVKNTSGGNTLLSFDIANSRDYFKDGAWVKRDPNYIKCTLWNPSDVQDIVKKIYKGTLVCVVGKLETESWEKDGVKNSRLCLILDIPPSVIKQSTQSDSPSGNTTQQPAVPSQPTTQPPMEDEIPF